MNILVCDDEKEIVDAIEIYLSSEGYTVLKAYDGLQALEQIQENEIHLIIMDVMMPKLNGIRTVMKMRQEHNIPVIMLSAKSEDADKIMGLNVGADDYVTKPFNPLELLARVKSQLRRYTRLGNFTPKSNLFKTGALAIDDESKTVTLDGEEIKLTPVEYKILLLLTQNAGRVFSIEQIYEQVWNEPAYNPENTVSVHIRHIREKLKLTRKSQNI